MDVWCFASRSADSTLTSRTEIKKTCIAVATGNFTKGDYCGFHSILYEQLPADIDSCLLYGNASVKHIRKDIQDSLISFDSLDQHRESKHIKVDVSPVSPFPVSSMSTASPPHDTHDTRRRTLFHQQSPEVLKAHVSQKGPHVFQIQDHPCLKSQGRSGSTQVNYNIWRYRWPPVWTIAVIIHKTKSIRYRACKSVALGSISCIAYCLQL